MDVVLPCLDEAAALPAVLASLPPGFRAIVVDNGSSDGSPEVAAACGALVVHEPKRGYGAAVHTGLLAATSDLVAFADADGSLDLAALPAMAALLADADLVAGRRRPVHAGVWPWHARAGNAVIASLLRRRGLDVHDIAPLRVCRREALLALDLQDRAFGYPLELLVRAAEAGWRVREVDVVYRPRAAGTRSKVSGSVRGTMRAARDMAGVLR
ncbi:glycosyltransferase family 2 protein [Lentzea sp. NEAU-D7]|uniref:glycosyltransferase family 2 protein n=1 Tax=Lentzea sp. NEAU-D7 TaxID=2994667 RepID=UPI00224BA10E|nr:glycosyltransferase family 2 protein [Lentzea sp. NEAU-D7]MCX2949289.1 glycosyltransferase family 2 protein [Lentzea sp. NEAU-D7]